MLCLVGMKKENDERIGKNYEEIAKEEKAKLLIKKINQYNELVKTAKESRRHLREVQLLGGE